MSNPFDLPSNWDRPSTGSPYPQPPKKKRWPWFAGGAVVVVAALVAIGSVSTDDTTTVADVEVAQSTSTTTPSMTPSSSTTASTAETPAATATPAAQITTSAAATAALAKLETLPVKGRAPKTGYARDQFGQTWTDDVTVEGGHNGCDTRNDILRRDLTSLEIKPGSGGCTVLSGVLNDPYTNTSINFVRGENTSTAVQIDHVVAMSNAWQTGAQQLSPQRRADLANDPRNLQAVDGPTNLQKSDGDAATWLPPNKTYRCTYVSRQIDVKAIYDLWVTQPEKDAITRLLTDCGAAAPTPSTTTTTAIPETRTQTPVPAVPQTSTPAYTPAPTPEYTPAPVAPVAVDPPSTYYQNCTEVRAAGAAPIYAGQPGYSTKLDRDRDGVACE